jgi:hypothetical protein
MQVRYTLMVGGSLCKYVILLLIKKMFEQRTSLHYDCAGKRTSHTDMYILSM